MASLPHRALAKLNAVPPGWVVLAAPVAGLVWLFLHNRYLAHLGFPFDEAWAHAAYGRSIALDRAISFNPGESAVAPSLLWSCVFAVAHWLTGDVADMVRVTKSIGFALHVGVTWIVYGLLRGDGGHRGAAVVAAILVGFHPTLIASSVSGVESVLVGLLLLLVARGAVLRRPAELALACASLPLARVEMTPWVLLIPLLINAFRRNRPLAGLLPAVAAGGISAALLVLRNMAVTGRPLPPTFYALANTEPSFVWTNLHNGFLLVFGQITILDGQLLMAACAFAALAVARTSIGGGAPTAAAMFTSGILLAVAAFATNLIDDPLSLHDQRLVHAAIPLLVAALPVLLDALISPRLPERPRWYFRGLAVLVLIASEAIHAPTVFDRITSDARNVDDLHVRVARAVSESEEKGSAMGIEVGALRYFGNRFVVDLYGVHTPATLTQNVAAFLMSHPPRFIDAIGTRMQFRPQPPEPPAVERLFEPSTAFTLNGSPGTAKHVLVSCPPGGGGVVTVRSPFVVRTGNPERPFSYQVRQVGFRCAD